MADQIKKSRLQKRARNTVTKEGKTLLRSQKHAQPDAIWHIDDQGICSAVVQAADPPTTSLLSQNRLPSRVHDVFPADAGRILLQLVRKAIAGGTAQVGELSFEVNGRNALLHVQVVPYTERGTLTVIHDISERLRTEKELRTSQRRLRKLTQHLQTAREEERARIAREIHDQMGQALTALKIDLACVRARVKSDPSTLEEDLAAMTKSVEALITSVHNIATELRPKILDDFGLSAAIEWQVDKFAKQTGIPCACSIPDNDLQIGNEVATALFRILQEALTNVVRHAHANNVSVVLEKQMHGITLQIHDDGEGVQEPDTSHPFALGMIGMKERARSLGGELTVTSRSSGGTCVSVRLPTSLTPNKLVADGR